ncbi:hypothetical protein ACFL7D_02940 [candidate division KSB1 bacterium]
MYPNGYTSTLYPNGIGDTYKLVKFEHNEPDDYYPTLVNQEGYFDDIPGFESLVEGDTQGKILGSLSLARQGHYFYWAYSIDPDKLTDGAKDTFANIVHYMYKNRDSKTVKRICTPRRLFWIYLDLYHRSDGYMRGIEEHVPNSLLPETRETYKKTVLSAPDNRPERYEQWLEENLAYVFTAKEEKHSSDTGRGTKYLYEIDSDAKALGTPNGDRASLERWIDLVNSGTKEQKEQAERCLKRYVFQDIYPEEGNWESWYEKYKDRIVFIESTGFWWQLDPTLPDQK